MKPGIAWADTLAASGAAGRASGPRHRTHRAKPAAEPHASCDCELPRQPAGCECEDEAPEAPEFTAQDLVFFGSGFFLNSFEASLSGLPRELQLTVSHLLALESAGSLQRLEVQGTFSFLPDWTLLAALRGLPPLSSGQTSPSGTVLDRGALGARLGVAHTWTLTEDSALTWGGGLDHSHLFAGPGAAPMNAPLDRLALVSWGEWTPGPWDLRLELLVPLVIVGPVQVPTMDSADALSGALESAGIPASLQGSLEVARELGDWSIDGEAVAGSYLDGAVRMYALAMVERRLPAGISAMAGAGLEWQSFPALSLSDLTPFGILGVNWSYQRAFGQSAGGQQ